MALSPEQMEAREGKLTASAVGALMSGHKSKIKKLWQEMVGDPSFTRPDLSNVWPVRLGSHTEELNLDWYQKQTGHPVTRRGEVVLHAEHSWAACTLDGWDEKLGIPIECKHVNGNKPLQEVIEFYTPQLFWQMHVTGTWRVAISVIEGAKEPAVSLIEWEDGYGWELWRRAEAFMQCVWTFTPPFEEAEKCPFM